MISYVRGKLAEKTPTYVVVETGGVGFKLWIPLSSFKALGEVGQDVRIPAYLHLREDRLQLFGFGTEEERDLFQCLISVSGVGPRVAQGILSGLQVDEFTTAVVNQDVETLTLAPGVGKKTAERLILELKDKVGNMFQVASDTRPGSPAPEAKSAVLALVSLGYKQSRAQEIVFNIFRKDSTISVEEAIRQALQKL